MTTARELHLERQLGHRAADGTLKRAFTSKDHVKRYLKRARGLQGRDRLMPYRCGVCPNWHIGHKLEAPRVDVVGSDE